MTTAVAHPDDALASCRLRPGVHGVVIRRDLVLLDTRSDSYLCLPDIGPATLENGVLRSLRDVAAALQRDGLARDDAGGTPDRVRPLPALPSRACRIRHPQPIAVREALSFTALWCALAGRRPEIGDLARRLAHRPAGSPDEVLLARRVDTFRRLMPAMPWTGACLFQSWMLLAFLNRGGLDADWVFGVRTWPFAAHCWLQVGDLCLTDAPEALTAYHPILAI
nr:lasso peptide biosynthesis B2 protein [Brevundimonas diminuta]